MDDAVVFQHETGFGGTTTFIGLDWTVCMVRLVKKKLVRTM